jgi:Domain of unknown function (DUF222)
MTSAVSVQLDGRVAGALAAGRWGEVVALVADGELAPDLSVVALLASVDPQLLDGDGRVDLIRALERCRAMLDGLQQSALVAVAEATEGRGLAEEQARHEVGAALRLSPGTAGERTWVATSLRRRLPAALSALQAGEISYLQAAHLVASVRELDDTAVGTVESRVLTRAPDQSLSEFKRAVRRAVLAVDPASAVDRHQKAVAARTIDRMGQPDGMESFWATMPASISRDLWATLTADAKAEQAARQRLGLPDPGIDALRVDVLVHAVLHNGGADPADPLLTTTGTADTAPTGTGAAGTASSKATRVPKCSCGGAQSAAVVIDLPTLLGLAERPGEIPGYGPIPAPVARAMAADRDWIRWTVHPTTGQLLDRGAKTYRPSDPLRAFVADRDRVCGFPGCNRRAEQCDCDHVVTFAHHGQTIRVNLGPLCRQHHNAKTHGLWKLTYDPDTGIKTWTSPLGKTYTKSTDPPLT